MLTHRVGWLHANRGGRAPADPHGYPILTSHTGASSGDPCAYTSGRMEAGQAVFRQAMLPRMVAMSAGSVHGLTIAKRVTVSPSWTVGVTKAKPVCNSFSVHS